MENFVTLFDSKFLPQGLALHLSLSRHLNDFKLWIICVDDLAYEILNKLQLKNTILLLLTNIETPELREVKAKRTRVDYFYTLTPFAPRFVFENDSSVKRVTYIDADLWFRKNPKPIFGEFEKSKKYVLITDHAYSPEYDSSTDKGQYCVQFMCFIRDYSEPVRRKWEEQCLEWCSSIPENGKFGDQKYLDTWPTEFADFVHVLENKELILAPWNAQRFPYGNSIAWHFHGLRIIVRKRKIKALIGNYSIPCVTRTNIYELYANDLNNAIETLQKINYIPISQASTNRVLIIKIFLSKLIQNFYPYIFFNRIRIK